MPVITPTVGRIVHYHPGEGCTPEPAIVTAVIPRTDLFGWDLDLTIFHNHPMPAIGRMGDVPYTATEEEGHWSWPPAAPTNTALA